MHFLSSISSFWETKRPRFVRGVMEGKHSCLPMVCSTAALLSMTKRGRFVSQGFSLIINLLLLFAAYAVADVAYYLENSSQLSPIACDDMGGIVAGFTLFTASIMAYTNMAWMVLFLILPRWRGVLRWLYVVVNAVCIAACLADAVYYTYTGRRTTATVFAEFSAEGNLASIVGHELLAHWYLLLLFCLIVWALWRLYRPIRQWHWTAMLWLVPFLPLAVGAMRGGFTTSVRPITVSNAGEWVRNPAHTALVLNTPFSMLRTVGKASYTDPAWFTADELDAIYNPVHTAVDDTVRRRNVVVFILESFGHEYVEQGYAPFLDSLSRCGRSYEYAFANGRKSIDGIPSVLSSIPMFVEPFVLTPYSMNKVSGLAGELAPHGYQSAFFHGAPGGSMGFKSYALSSGFQTYHGMEDYVQWAGGDGEFDGTWAIWDEPFLQYMAATLGTMQQPFVSAVFTASSHHPYRIPPRYEGRFPKGSLPIHQCIGYSDNALRRFFEAARRQPWFDNTLFVITADHTNQSCTPQYQTFCGLYRVPLVFYAPGDSLFAGRDTVSVAQQIDILPTVLHYLGLPHRTVAFGCDLLATPPSETWAVSDIIGMYQYITPDTLMLFDGTSTFLTFDWRRDTLLQQPLLPRPLGTSIETRLKAVVQSYMQRMLSDRLTATD